MIRAEKEETKPPIVFWELTQACDLACVHCRASARPNCDPRELGRLEGEVLLDELSDWKVPMLVVTGGDPLKHPSFWKWLAYAQKKNLPVAVTPSPTPLVTPEAVRRMKELGVRRLGLSLDGAAAATHDRFRGVPGSFAQVLEIVGKAIFHSLPIQINTTLTPHNVSELEAMAEWVRWTKAELWSLFFLVPVGRGTKLPQFSPDEFEKVFGLIHQLQKKYGLAVKTTEAPHYRRYVLQHTPSEPLRGRGFGDGRGIVFVSHAGEIYPSGFLPLAAGNVKVDSLKEVYLHAELFRSLRNPNLFRGKCGACEFRFVCGGSRARACAATGDPLESDPFCGYQPATGKKQEIAAL